MAFVSKHRGLVTANR